MKLGLWSTGKKLNKTELGMTLLTWQESNLLELCVPLKGSTINGAHGASYYIETKENIKYVR